MKISIIQHKLANFDSNNDPLHRILRNETISTSIINWKSQLMFCYDLIIFDIHTSFNLIA